MIFAKAHLKGYCANYTLVLESPNMQNVAVEKNQNENNTSVIRRFTKRVQESGVLRRVRSIRYTDRKKSDYVKKKNTLKVLRKKAKIEEYLRLGKPVELLKRK